jgi:protein TonB
MFDHVTKKKGVRRAGRQGLFLLGSSALQIALVVGLILVASAIKARVVDEPVVPVKFIRSAAPVPLALPPAALPPKPPANRHRPTDAPKAPPPTALVQPRELPQADVDLNPAEPPEEVSPVPNESDAVVGGALNAASVQPIVAAKPRHVDPVVKDDPTYAGAGFTRPQQAEKNCVQTTLRIPRGLEGSASSVTVKFAIAKDGTPSLFQVQPPEPNARLTSAIWQAVQACRWIAGTNPKGEPTKIWVVMPFRFQAS